jgi:cysteinyl-tRNA synthetase
LLLLNSLTNTKTPFVPGSASSTVRWYSCGPTVYDSSHLGHARTYLAFDIVRRILEDYFQFGIEYVQNVTDIDDKIILRARQDALFERYEEEVAAGKRGAAEVLADLRTSWEAYNVDMTAKVAAALKDGDRNLAALFEEKLAAGQAALKAVQGETKDVPAGALATAKEPLCKLLDGKHGHEPWINIQERFRAHAARFEQEFFEDMETLGVRLPTAVTRVSEYVPEVIALIENIVSNGYGYVTDDGSVYFDTNKFDAAPSHFYAKLEPHSFGNAKLLEEGEGALSTGGKRSPNDFVLWKGSKPGEPTWDSPWGQGRPGWHIECSAMAGAHFGANFDIHTGGSDLKFPHHDNEMAQSESGFEHYYGREHKAVSADCSPACNFLLNRDSATHPHPVPTSPQVINYFLHTGHLHIAGAKMSKSLKNFVTIRQALDKYSARALRIFFLQVRFNQVMNFADSAMDEVAVKERTLGEFFLLAKAAMRTAELAGEQHWADADFILQRALSTAQAAVHAALCDSIDTPTALNALFTLVTATNSYLKDRATVVKEPLLRAVVSYVRKMFRIFGVIRDDDDIGQGLKSAAEAAEGGVGGGASKEEVVGPFLDVFADFRRRVRELAKAGASSADFLALSDSVRDEDCVKLGLRIEDSDVYPWKLVNPEELAADLAKKQAEAAKVARAKQAARAKKAAADLAKLQKGAVSPSTLFRTDEFGSWDEAGVPLTLASGDPIPKSRKKKVDKVYASQVKAHNEYQAKLKEEPGILERLAAEAAAQ